MSASRYQGKWLGVHDAVVADEQRFGHPNDNGLLHGVAHVLDRHYGSAIRARWANIDNGGRMEVDTIELAFDSGQRFILSKWGKRITLTPATVGKFDRIRYHNADEKAVTNWATIVESIEAQRAALPVVKDDVTLHTDTPDPVFPDFPEDDDI